MLRLFVVFCALAALVETQEELKAIDPVRIGYVQKITSAPPDTRVLELHTLSVKPPIFLVPELMNETEVDGIVARSANSFWHQSQVTSEGSHTVNNDLDSDGVDELRKMMRDSVKGDYDNLDGLMKFMHGIIDKKQKISMRNLQKDGKGKETLHKTLASVDANRDGALSLQELKTFARTSFNMPNYGPDTHAALVAHVRKNHATVNTEVDGDVASLSLEDVLEADVPAFFTNVLEEQPHLRYRWSEETRLPHSEPLVQRLLSRAQAISGLSQETIQESEDLQVVKYGRLGHYSCHHDRSNASGVRLATLAIFLNTPLKGGETAFPAANKPETALWTPKDWNDFQASCQEIHKCTGLGGVIVPPRKGSGIFWYNVNPADLNAGKMNTFIKDSLHCAGQVTEGEKWFANLWLRTDKFQTRGQPTSSVAEGSDEESVVRSDTEASQPAPPVKAGRRKRRRKQHDPVSDL